MLAINKPNRLALFRALFFVVNMIAISFPSSASGASPKLHPLKLGCVNVALVKSLHPELRQARTLRQNAENTLRLDLSATNQVEQHKQESYAKQQALSQLTQADDTRTTLVITAAIAEVARAKNLDIVIDSDSVFVGGPFLDNNAEDITEAVLKTLPFTIIVPHVGLPTEQ